MWQKTDCPQFKNAKSNDFFLFFHLSAVLCHGNRVAIHTTFPAYLYELMPLSPCFNFDESVSQKRIIAKRADLHWIIREWKIRRYFQQKYWLAKIIEAFSIICQDISNDAESLSGEKMSAPTNSKSTKK